MNPEQAAAFVYVLIAVAITVLVLVTGAWLWQVGFPRAFDAVRRHFARTEVDELVSRQVSHVRIVFPKDES